MSKSWPTQFPLIWPVYLSHLISHHLHFIAHFVPAALGFLSLSWPLVISCVRPFVLFTFLGKDHPQTFAWLIPFHHSFFSPEWPSMASLNRVVSFLILLGPIIIFSFIENICHKLKFINLRVSLSPVSFTHCKFHKCIIFCLSDSLYLEKYLAYIKHSNICWMNGCS